jgi:HlyD family secretion protein
MSENRSPLGSMTAHAGATGRRRWLAALAGSVVLVGLLWALRPSPVQVDLAEISRGAMRVTVDEEGKTRVRRVFVVSAPVTGKLRRSLLDPGDAVVGGETVIAVMEPSAPAFLDVRSRQEAEAQVAAARAAVALAEAEVRLSDAELSWAWSELQRTQSLAQTSVVSARSHERARLEHDKQMAAVARAKSNLDVRTAELATASAHLIGPETMSAARADASGCCVEVRSPQSGVVLRELQESERVIAAGTPLFEIGDPADIDIVVELLSTDAVRVSPGAQATIEGAGLAERLTARVRRIEPAGFTKVSALGIEEQRVRTFLDLDAPASQRSALGHDYRVFTRIAVWSSAEALRLPLSAVFRIGDSWAVYKAADGRAVLTPVEIGQRNNAHADVLSGLVPGDKVVMHPSDRVTAGTRIRQIAVVAAR